MPYKSSEDPSNHVYSVKLKHPVVLIRPHKISERQFGRLETDQGTKTDENSSVLVPSPVPQTVMTPRAPAVLVRQRKNLRSWLLVPSRVLFLNTISCSIYLIWSQPQCKREGIPKTPKFHALSVLQLLFSDWKWPPPLLLPLEVLRKFIRFGTLTRPLDFCTVFPWSCWSWKQIILATSFNGPF